MDLNRTHVRALVACRDELETEITSMSFSIGRKKDIVTKLNLVLQEVCNHVWMTDFVESTNEYGEVDTVIICDVCSIVKETTT